MIMRGLLSMVVVILLTTGCQKKGDDSESLSNTQGGLPGLLKPENPDQSSTSNQPTETPSVTSGHALALTQHKWCRKIEAEGVAYLERWELKNNKQVHWTAFRFDGAGARGPIAGQALGTWSVAGSQLTLDFGGQVQVFELNHNPEGPTGAPQLQINKNNYDPCP